MFQLAMMRLRHTTALALVAWYLMLPPISLRGVDVSAPLPKWTMYQDYDSFLSCTVAETELHNRGWKDSSATPPLQFPRAQLEQFAAADCVVSNDPRLKAK